MRVRHNISADFDDPNLVSAAGLVPVMALAETAGLSGLVDQHVSVAGAAGANATWSTSIGCGCCWPQEPVQLYYTRWAPPCFAVAHRASHSIAS